MVPKSARSSNLDHLKLRKVTHLQLIITIIITFTILGSFATWWYFRPNTLQLNPALQLEELTPLGADGTHNSNTDLTYWNKSFFAIFQNSNTHPDTGGSRLLIKQSIDNGTTWTLVHELRANDGEIRDPHFAIIGNRLFLYVLRNQGFFAIPYQTNYCYTENGINWTTIEPTIGTDKWLFWAPKTRDNITWYVGTYWYEHGRSAIFKSTDGINWALVTELTIKDGNDETDIHFLPDGRMVCTIRAEHFPNQPFGANQGGTAMGFAEGPDYTDWQYIKSMTGRLDGPAIFTVGSHVYAVGRYQPEVDFLMCEPGSLFANRRTAIYSVEDKGLTYLTDLPSASDTSYAGVVVLGDYIYISYYTSDIRYDRIWVYGMFLPSDVKFVRIPLTSLEAMRLSPNDDAKVIPWGIYLILVGGFLINGFSWRMITKRNRKIGRF